MGKATKAKAAKPARDVLADTAAASDVPDAQRDRDRLALADTTIEDGHRRAASQTVCRLTRVELLGRSGVLEPHEVQACEWYAGVAALAWDTTGGTARYEGGGGGGGAHAPDRLMARYQAIADARDDYRDARALLGKGMGDAFEAIVLRNDALGPTAAAAFPDLARSQAGHRLRITVKFCANVLHQRFGRLMGWADAPAVVALVARPAASPTMVRSPRLADTIGDAIACARYKGDDPDQLWIARPCYDALIAELGAEPDMLSGLAIVVREEWRWGYVAISAADVPVAA